MRSASTSSAIEEGVRPCGRTRSESARSSLADGQRLEVGGVVGVGEGVEGAAIAGDQRVQFALAEAWACP